MIKLLKTHSVMSKISSDANLSGPHENMKKKLLDSATNLLVMGLAW